MILSPTSQTCHRHKGTIITVAYFLTENQIKACHNYSIDEVRTMYDSLSMSHTVVINEYSDTILAYLYNFYYDYYSSFIIMIKLTLIKFKSN